ncbi:MAG: hypothetical protein Q9169_006505 [Polycauliona sp. 2 TL-2023]
MGDHQRQKWTRSLPASQHDRPARMPSDSLISEIKPKDPRRVQQYSLSAKDARVQKIRGQKARLISKAKEDAKMKALGRAIERFALDATVQAPQSPSQPLLLSLPYAMTFITNEYHAKEAYEHLPASLVDPSYVMTLSNKNQRRVRLLLRKEEELRSMAERSESQEIALVHQDERVAIAKHRQALRDEIKSSDGRGPHSSAKTS